MKGTAGASIPDPMVDDGSGPAPPAKTYPAVRWTVAVLLLVALGGISLWGDHGGPLTTCTDYVARVGTIPVISRCSGVSIGDTPTIVIFVAVALLLLPDVTRISFAGIINIEREVKRQRERTEDLIARISLMTQTVQFNPNITIVAGEPSKAAEAAESKASEFFGDVAPQ